jgi:K+-sensing histidine kinase KdpD
MNLHLEEEREVNEILIKTVSHDVANPLTVISAYTDMLQAKRIAESDHQMIFDRLKLNTRSALDMIARIREAIVTRNKASIVRITDVSIDLSIKRLLNQFDTILKNKNLSVKYHNDLPQTTSVAAEENALTEHVFANVLSNAIKFSYDNSVIEINVKEDESHVMVEFRDHGQGIDMNRLERRHLQSTQGTHGENGSGFGVMVMGYFLRQFGASHGISSEGVDMGTSVTITLKKTLVRRPSLTVDQSSANIFS